MAPTLDLLRGTKTMKCLRELEESQWWPREKILELQDQRLRKLVKYAYENVPYYRRIFDERGLKPEDIKTSRDLVKLPVLTKQIIRKDFYELTARGFPSKQRIQLTTGGSTGEPLVFYSTKEDRFNWGFARARRALRWAGKNIAGKTVLLQERRLDVSRIAKFGQAFKRFFQRSVILDTREIPRKLAVFAKQIEEFQPKFISGYPSVIYLVARLIEREGKSGLRLRAVITGAEPLYDYQRELFRRVLECETYSIYSSWEAHNIAAECPEHSGHHIAAENIIVEIVGDEGEPVPAGVEGRILITNLHNYAMPFIRYDIGDVGIGSAEVCSCGRGLPLLAAVTGRTCDFIFTRDGERIPGISLPWGFLTFLGVEQFQIVQESYEHMTVRLVLSGEYTQELIEQLTTEVVRQYKPILGEDMHITVEFVDKIVPTAAGKTKFVISNLPPMDTENL